jgi:GntR family transcriptional regulator
MALINYQDSRPIYEQIASHFELMILSGVMKPDEQLPSVRTLAIELSTNPNTVQKAFTDLENHGYIYSVKGLGNFVKENPSLRDKKKSELTEKIRAVFDEADMLGFDVDEIIKEARALR